MNETALKERLKIVAKEKDVLFNVIWKQLLLERFLARLSSSEHHDHFIFKGAMLLSQHIEIGRETSDLDFLLNRYKGEIPSLETAFHEITAVSIADGFTFKLASIEVLKQPHMDYPGFRARLNATLGKMRDSIQIDIGVGDQVQPVEDQFHPFEYKGKPIFEGEITLLTYPVATIFAEKLEAIVSKGGPNSRMKDYHDALLMLREKGLLTVASVKTSIAATFRHRNTSLSVPICFTEEELARLEPTWALHLTRISKVREKLALPEKIADVLAEINAWLSANGIEEVKS